MNGGSCYSTKNVKSASSATSPSCFRVPKKH